jgi:hypothetical protein
MIRYLLAGLTLAAASVAVLPFTLFWEGADESDESLLLLLTVIAAIFFLPPFIASLFIRAGRVAADTALGGATVLLLILVGLRAPWFVGAAFCLLAVLGGFARRALARAAV